MPLLEDYYQAIAKQETKQEKQEREQKEHIGRSGFTVDVYTDKGFYVASFNGVNIAAEIMKINNRTLRKYIKKGETFRGYKFKFRNDRPTILPNPEKSSLPRKYRSKSANQGKLIKQVFSGSVVGVFGSITEAAHKTNINRNSIAKCLRGFYKSAGGYVWETINN